MKTSLADGGRVVKDFWSKVLHVLERGARRAGPKGSLLLFTGNLHYSFSMKILLLLCFLVPATAGAAGDRAAYLGLGTFFQNMLKVTDSPTSKASFFGETYLPEVVVGYRMQRFFPSFGWTILGNKSNDGDKRRAVMRLDLPYLFPFGRVELKAGLGLMIYRIYGNSSTVTLRNGGTTSNFYVPDGSRSSRIFYVGTGGALRSGQWRTDLDILLGGVLTKRRSFNMALRAGYEF